MRLDGVVERRLLVNYRVEPDVVSPLLPPGLRPQLVDGAAVAGICLIRMGSLRPRGLPGWLGLRSENAAHRVAVEWGTPDGVRTGVYIPRRDSGSPFNVVAGGRLFPGPHGLACFDVVEDAERLRVAFRTRDGAVAVDVRVRVADALRGSTLFTDAGAASRFFESGGVGWSETGVAGRLDGLRLRTDAWRVEPVEIEHARSSWFEDPRRFPAGSAVLDSALLMRRVPVWWEQVHASAGPTPERVIARR